MKTMEFSTMEPVKRVSVTEMVTERILSMIREGVLKPGDKLPSQRELEAMLQVSRPSLREALTGLIVLGYIEARAGQGYFVRSTVSQDMLEFSIVETLVNDDNISDLYEARLFFETSIVVLAAKRATDEDIKKLYEHLEKIEKALPSVDSIILGLEFHQMVADSVHNPVLSSVEKTLLKLFEDYARRVFPKRPSHKFDVESHRRIVDCIANHDVLGAYQMSVQDIRVFLNDIGVYSKDSDFEDSHQK